MEVVVISGSGAAWCTFCCVVSAGLVVVRHDRCVLESSGMQKADNLQT